VPRRVFILLMTLFACRHRPTIVPVQGGAAALLGTWEYHGGLQVMIVIDSAAGDRFQGRVTFWLAGDAGSDARAFGPVAGTLTATRAAFTIPYTRGGAAPMRVRARLAGDTLTVDDGRPFATGGRFLRTARPTSSH
jgi:hypothetical protein